MSSGEEATSQNRKEPYREEKDLYSKSARVFTPRQVPNKTKEPPDAWRSSREHEQRGLDQFGVQPPGNIRPLESQHVDFTLVTQASVGRLWVLQHICNRWEGPILVSVFTANIAETRRARLRTHLNKCPQAKMVMVDEISGLNKDWSDPRNFPINILRNMAIAEVKTSHYLLIDVDFWPNKGLYHILRGFAAPGSTYADEFTDPFKALVVPAFHLNPPSNAKFCLPDQLPLNIPALHTCLRSKQCEVFHIRNAPQGHLTTNTTYVLKHQYTDKFYQIPCFKSDEYEPYVVLRKGPPTPSYADVFAGYGKNKIQHIVHLRMRGFRFAVLPQAFLVHFPHKKSDARALWDNKKGNINRIRMQDLYDRFVGWAKEERAASEETLVPQCRRKKRKKLEEGAQGDVADQGPQGVVAVQ